VIPAPFETEAGAGSLRPAAPSWTVVSGLYRLLLRQQLTKGRALLASALGGLAILVAVVASRNEGPEVRGTVEFLSVYGLGLTVPILSLVLASSSLGQLVEDEVLVYLWLRPIPRWMLSLAAWLASATVAVPFTVVPMVVAAAIGSDGDPTAVLAVAIAMALGALAYTSIFTLVGLLVRRALIWGLVYVFVWELFVARVGAGAARLSINTYPASVLAEMTDVELPLAERSLAYGVCVPIAVALAGVAATAWRLNRTNVA
jgi:ABC-2 type transport system permease protein